MNKRTAETIAAVEESGLTPLDYLLSVMRDEGKDEEIRMEAAKAAAPFVHAKLSNVMQDLRLDVPDPISAMLADIATNGTRLGH